MAPPASTSETPVAGESVPPDDSDLPAFDDVKEVSMAIARFPGVGAFPDARVRSRFAVRSVEPPDSGWVDFEITRTFVGDVTITDITSVVDEVGANPDVGAERTVERGITVWELQENGEWTSYESEQQGYTPVLMHWSDAQGMASGFFEAGAEIVGWDEVAGRPAMHVVLADSTDAPGSSGEMWIDAEGVVVKALTEVYDDHPSAPGHIVMEWEVLEFDPELAGPLPPDF